MGIQVTLLDKSSIVQKMLTHCLYYFAAEVQRFENFEDSKEHIADKRSDIVFVDWNLKQGTNPVIHTVVKEVTDIPVVLLYRSMDDMEIKALPPNYVAHKIKKPLDPKAFRDTFTQLVPKARDSILHRFLKFPKTSPAPQETTPETTQDMSNTLFSATEKKTPPLSANRIAFPKKDPTATDESLEIETIVPIELQKKTQEPSVTSQQASSVKSPSLKVKPPLQQTVALKDSTQKTDSMKDLSQNISLTAMKKTALKKEEQSQPLSPPVSSTTRHPIKKEDIDIDENTQNDLAPMAIKSSPSIQENFIDQQNFELSEKNILKVLNKYKDTLEFQNSIEKFLSGYAKETALKVLKEDKITKDTLQQSLENFKNSQKFKQLIEEQIGEYVKRHLPLIIKDIVKQKIDKIIGEI